MKIDFSQYKTSEQKEALGKIIDYFVEKNGVKDTHISYTELETCLKHFLSEADNKVISDEQFIQISKILVPLQFNMEFLSVINKYSKMLDIEYIYNIFSDKKNLNINSSTAELQ